MGNSKNSKLSMDNFMNSLSCQSDIPFPEIKIEKPNIAYANLLHDPYASSITSELQAITQYIYHHETIENERVSKTLMCIAIVEMRHLDTLSSLINKLGGNPVFCDSIGNWFMAGKLAYFYNDALDKDNNLLCKKIESDISGEKEAIRGYKNLLLQIDDKYIKKVLEKIISDEEVHIHILNGILKDYCNTCK